MDRRQVFVFEDFFDFGRRTTSLTRKTSQGKRRVRPRSAGEEACSGAAEKMRVPRRAWSKKIARADHHDILEKFLGYHGDLRVQFFLDLDLD